MVGSSFEWASFEGFVGGDVLAEFFPNVVLVVEFGLEDRDLFGEGVDGVGELVVFAFSGCLVGFEVGVFGAVSGDLVAELSALGSFGAGKLVVFGLEPVDDAGEVVHAGVEGSDGVELCAVGGELVHGWDVFGEDVSFGD